MSWRDVSHWVSRASVGTSYERQPTGPTATGWKVPDVGSFRLGQEFVYPCVFLVQDLSRLAVLSAIKAHLFYVEFE